MKCNCGKGGKCNCGGMPSKKKGYSAGGVVSHVNPSKRLDSKGATPKPKKGTPKNRAMAGSSYYYPDDMEKALKRQASLNETERSYKMDTAMSKYKKTKTGDKKKYGFK